MRRRAGDPASALLTGGFLVKVLGGLVEDDHGEAGQQHPGQGQPLMLAVGQPGARAGRGRQRCSLRERTFGPKKPEAEHATMNQSPCNAHQSGERLICRIADP